MESATAAPEGALRVAARPIVPDDFLDDLAEAIADKIGDYIIEGLL